MIGYHHTLGVKQSSDGHRENCVGLRRIQTELVKWGNDSNKRCYNEIISRRHLIQSPEHTHIGWSDANLLMAFP